MGPEEGVICLNSAMVYSRDRKLLSTPHSQDAATLLAVFRGIRLLTYDSSQFVEISCRLGIGLTQGIAPADGLQHLHVLIWHFPEKFLADHLFDLAFADDAPVLVAVENHPQPVGGDLFPRKVVGLPHHVA